MDSRNSGSLQSSSGGDVEYDSRAAWITAFFNNNPTAHVSSIHPPLAPSHTSKLGPVSDYLQLQKFSSFFDPNLMKTLRSEPCSTDIISPVMDSSPFIGSSSNAISTNFVSTASVSATAGVAGDYRNQSRIVRNPKKRLRASRRAPTTVLTTDTTNFRAMVQEFTGIPPPPFTTTLRSGSSLDTALPPYLRRPFPQKVPPPPPPFLSPSVLDHALASSSTRNNESSNQFSNPFLNTLLQSKRKFPFANSSNLGPKDQNPSEIPFNDLHVKMGGLGEYNLDHGHVNDLPRNENRDSYMMNINQNPDNSKFKLSSWDNGDGNRVHLRSINGNFNFSTNPTNGLKLNYPASSSNFHGNKGPESVATRGEGMVESWICSSD